MSTVSMTTSASSGCSYGSEIPVNSFTMPARAFAYRPLRSRASHASSDVAMCTRMKPPPFSTIARTACRGAGQPGEEDREALARAWRIRTPQLFRNRRRREPMRQVAPFVQAPALLGPRDVQDAHAVGHFIFGDVRVQILHVDHLLEGNHRHAELRFVRAQRILRVVRPVEGLPVTTVARPCVVASD